MSSSKRNSKNSFWTTLKQQTLPALQPVYTTKTISPIFLAFGVILIPLGVALFKVSEIVQEVAIDYTDCISTESNEKCADIIVRDRTKPCHCVINFTIATDMKGEIRLYYALTNFFQNHREYVKSRDDNQLLGEIGSLENLASPAKDCQPLDKDPNGRPIFPCGAIANSMFNDTINLLISDDAGKNTNIALIRKGIAWETDKKYKFQNPKQFPKEHPIWNDLASPRDWNRTIWDLDPEDPENNGLQNEDFIVWMRTAALPNFRKLHRIIDSKSLGFGPNEGLRKGNYSLEIKYEFEVKSFEGTKSIILAELNNFIGGRNTKLGIVFMSAGSVVMALGLLFLVGYVRRRKSWSRGNSGKRQSYGTCRSATEIENHID